MHRLPALLTAALLALTACGGKSDGDIYRARLERQWAGLTATQQRQVCAAWTGIDQEQGERLVALGTIDTGNLHGFVNNADNRAMATTEWLDMMDTEC